MKNKIRKAFTLIETILALALFAMAASAISYACYNTMLALDMKDKDIMQDVLKDQIIQAVQGVGSLDELEEDIEIEGIDDEDYDISCEATQTEILDLFDVSITVEINKVEKTFQLFLIRPDWYEETDERTEILDDRTEYLEDTRTMPKIHQ